MSADVRLALIGLAIGLLCGGGILGVFFGLVWAEPRVEDVRRRLRRWLA